MKPSLRFFEQKDTVSPPAPDSRNDPTLLFTNFAGMNQFKGLLPRPGKARLYRAPPPASRSAYAPAANNDLENVGYTARHHTFFEMLGNFSFGDYFKRDVFVSPGIFDQRRRGSNCRKETLGHRLYQRRQAYDIWNKEIGVPAERMIRIGDNKGRAVCLRQLLGHG